MITWTIVIIRAKTRCSKRFTQIDTMFKYFQHAMKMPKSLRVEMWENNFDLFGVPFSERVYLKKVWIKSQNRIWLHGYRPECCYLDTSDVPRHGRVAKVMNYSQRDNPFFNTDDTRARLWDTQFTSQLCEIPYFRVNSYDCVPIFIQAILEWDYSYFEGFQYDWITDKEITEALTHPVLEKLDITIEHEADYDSLHDIPVRDYHILRVAVLVNYLHEHVLVKSIGIDTIYQNKCCSCIGDGHHRIRALQYLKAAQILCDLQGCVSELDKLLDLNKKYYLKE